MILSTIDYDGLCELWFLFDNSIDHGRCKANSTLFPGSLNSWGPSANRTILLKKGLL